MAPAGDGVHQPQEAEEEEKLQELGHHYSEIMQGEAAQKPQSPCL